MSEDSSATPPQAAARVQGGVARAVAAARALIATASIAGPEDIHVARLAGDAGATVVFRDTGAADGRIVRGSTKALIVVNERLAGTPRARWTVAHELGHFLLHADHDALDRIHCGGAKTGGDFQVEREADAFTTELLMSEVMFAPRCDARRPTILTLDTLAGEYGTSLTATGRRYTTFATAACAMVECKDGRILRAARSATFRGEAKQRRALETGTLAARLLRGEVTSSAQARVSDGAWGSARVGVEMHERAILVVESGVVLAWLWHRTAT